MKLEPLKDKGNIGSAIWEVANSPKHIIMYYYYDVKSAVKWLKNEIRKDFFGGRIVSDKDINIKIDKAFEDVMRK